MSSRLPLRFIPQLFERIWGGQALVNQLGKQAPHPEKNYGESWEICDREELSSLVSEGEYQGLTLHELWTTHREELFGQGYERFVQFPLIAKILDARDLLSLQVHPPKHLAQSLGGQSKTECWYVYKTSPKAQLIAGWKYPLSLEELKEKVTQKDLASVLHTLEPKEGDCLFIPSGRVHALGAGLLIFEIQENSDTTYRLYDWDRKDNQGQERELHLEKGLQSVDLEDICPSFLPSQSPLIDCPEFELRQEDALKGQSVEAQDREHFALLIVAQGQVEWPHFVAKEGDFLLIPRHSLPGLVTSPEARLLWTRVPTHPHGLS